MDLFAAFEVCVRRCKDYDVSLCRKLFGAACLRVCLGVCLAAGFAICVLWLGTQYPPGQSSSVCLALAGIAGVPWGKRRSEADGDGSTDTEIRNTELQVTEVQKSEIQKTEIRDPGAEPSRFLAGADASLDGLCVLVAERVGSEIVDFRLHYMNAKARKLLGRSDTEVPEAGQSSLRSDPILGAYFEALRRVVEAGDAREQDLGARAEVDANIKVRAVCLSDGVAVTLTDASEIRIDPRQYENLAQFTDLIFENAPFGIVATDVDGVITAMNVAAEVLTGYERKDLVGKAPLTLLNDPRELVERAKELPVAARFSDDFEILSAKAATEGMEEREWTFTRRDGSKTAVSLALRGVTGRTGELTGFVGVAFDVTDRRQMLNYVTHLATHDQLTGLVGRSLLQDRIALAIERSRRYGTKVGLFVLDLDGFRRINTSLGHRAGDQVLLETARRLREAVRSTDTVARVGGDAFVVVMEDLTTSADAERCASTLLEQLRPEMDIEQQRIQITATLGLCVYPDCAEDGLHLLKRADAAMYSAKESGGNQQLIFSDGMLRETANRLSMEQSLRQALKREELCLFYQPQVSLSTGAVVGMEALMRWRHPRLGLLEPAQFIPLAEESGLMLAMGEWAFRRGCMEGQELRSALRSDLTVSVNLSPRQLQQKHLLEMIESALAESGLPASSLEIEITENTLMVNSPATLEKLQRIRELGVRIAIDDFGTGFCNFTYLLEYKVDRLKIDQRFVKLAAREKNAAAVVRSIIAMSHGLGIKVVAEGVEEEEQLAFLRRRRCDEAQGYLFARPVPTTEFRAAVERCNSGTFRQSA